MPGKLLTVNLLQALHGAELNDRRRCTLRSVRNRTASGRGPDRLVATLSTRPTTLDAASSHSTPYLGE